MASSKDVPISEELILKYLNPSPAMAKVHMKKLQHGIRSTAPHAPTTQHNTQPPIPINPPVPVNAPDIPRYQIHNQPTLIANDCDALIGKIFCFGEFSNKNSGVVYHDMTGNFPFMSLDGLVCFFIMYQLLKITTTCFC